MLDLSRGLQSLKTEMSSPAHPGIESLTFSGNEIQPSVTTLQRGNEEVGEARARLPSFILRWKLQSRMGYST